MGVMACNRTRCRNIMCDRLILDDTYYICNDCYAELCMVKGSWPRKMAKSDVARLIEEFMLTCPNSFVELNGDEIDEEFNRLVSNRF